MSRMEPHLPTEPQIIFRIASNVVSICILMPIEIWWFYMFWILRKNAFISQRKPKMLLTALSLFWVEDLLNMIYYFFGHLYNEKGPVWSNDIFICSLLGRDLAWAMFTAVNISRYWLLFFS